MIVAEELSFTHAAEKLHMSQPPLGRRIKELEDEVGAPLFERHARGLSLTQVGKFLLEHARIIIDRTDATLAATKHLARTNHEVFNIGLVGSMLYGNLPKLIRELKNHDNIHLQLHEMPTVSQFKALKAGIIDIGFGRLYLDDNDIEQQLLFDEPLMVAVPCTHPLVGTTPDLQQIAQYPLILYPSRPRPSFADNVKALFRLKTLKINVIQEVNEMQTALGLVASDMGIALVPQQARAMQRRDIAFLDIDSKQAITSPIIMSRRKEPPTPAMLLTLELLDRTIKNRQPIL